MKNNSVVVANRWWLAILWWLSVALTAQAQTAQPPLIQWQRVMPGNAEFVTPAYVVKASDGALGVITAKQELLKLSASGETVWTSPIPAQNAGSGSGLVAQSPAGLVPTPDGGFVVLARDIIGWYITKFNATGVRIWIKKIVDDSGYSLGYSEDKLIQTMDGGFLLTGTRGIKQSNRGTFITKVDQAGNVSWETEVNYPFNLPAGDGSATVASGALSLPDGGYLLVGLTQTFSGNTTFSSWAAKLDNLGQLIWQNKYDSQALLDDVILSPFGDGSYIAAGSVTNSANNSASHTELLTIQADGTLGRRSSIDGSKPAGLVGFKVSIVAASTMEGGPSYTIFDTDKQNQGDFRLTNVGPKHQVQWTKRLGGTSAEIAQSIVATDNGYVAVGYSNSIDGDLIGQNNQLGGGTWVVRLVQPPVFTMQAPTYTCQTGAITFNTSGGDGSTITYLAPGISRSSLTSNMGTVEPGLRHDPKPITITATQSGYSVSYTFDFAAYCANSPVTPPTGSPLTLLAPTYDCTTGAFRFNTSGGNGTLIEYRSVPGITDWTSNPNQFVDTELRTANDVLPLTLMARQSGVLVTYRWDLRAVCPNPPALIPLTLLVPTYDCTTGAFRFNTSGGNGTLIEYRSVPGITDWTSNPNQFVDTELRTANDVLPLTLMARQSGVLVTYRWDLKAACGRAGARRAEPVADLTVSVLGNPVSTAVTVEVRGAEGQPLRLRLVDGQGRLVENRLVEQAGETEHQRFDVPNWGPGLLLLRASSGTQSKTVKILKQ